MSTNVFVTYETPVLTLSMVLNRVVKDLTLLLILSIVLSALSKTWIDLIPNIVSTTNNIIPIIYNNTCNTKIVVSMFSPFIPRTLNQLNQRD